MRREFLQLAKTYRPGKDKIAGWYASEKLDGTRCFWDGGLSRGLPTADVPWASVTDPKTGNRKAKVKPYATGLWSRYGNPIIAPEEFLDLLPSCPLDGELWAGRGKFQLCRSICGGDSPDPRFEAIQFAVYGAPPINLVAQSGEIKNANMVAKFSLEEIAKWIDERCEKTDFLSLDEDACFDNEIHLLDDLLEGDRVYLHRQVRLPNSEGEAQEAIEAELNRVLAAGGEGLILRDGLAHWTPKRVSSLLKFKPFQDDEGKLVGFTTGRETDKGSKHRGKIGALILDYNGKRLELSGLTDEEREFGSASDSEYAFDNPGKDMPVGTKAKHFKVGQKITFIFREHTDDGIPKEARYLRPRDDEE
jgi:DNA ligase-1